MLRHSLAHSFIHSGIQDGKELVFGANVSQTRAIEELQKASQPEPFQRMADHLLRIAGQLCCVLHCCRLHSPLLIIHDTCVHAMLWWLPFDGYPLMATLLSAFFTHSHTHPATHQPSRSPSCSLTDSLLRSLGLSYPSSLTLPPTHPLTLQPPHPLTHSQRARSLLACSPTKRLRCSYVTTHHCFALQAPM